jgi:hypothetical protein
MGGGNAQKVRRWTYLNTEYITKYTHGVLNNASYHIDQTFQAYFFHQLISRL